MKITTRSKTKPEPKIVFPAHFKGVVDDSIVLAFSDNIGVIVEQGYGSEEVGELGTDWAPFSNTEKWTRVHYKTTFED